MRHEIIFHDDYFEIKTFGDADYEGFQRFTDELLNHPEFRTGMRMLVDHRELNFEPLYKFSRVEGIAGMHVSRKDRIGKAKIATIRPRDVQEVYLNLWKTMCDYFGVSFEHEIFIDRDTALQWLLSGISH